MAKGVIKKYKVRENFSLEREIFLKDDILFVEKKRTDVEGYHLWNEQRKYLGFCYSPPITLIEDEKGNKV